MLQYTYGITYATLRYSTEETMLRHQDELDAVLDGLAERNGTTRAVLTDPVTRHNYMQPVHWNMPSTVVPIWRGEALNSNEKTVPVLLRSIMVYNSLWTLVRDNHRIVKVEATPAGTFKSLSDAFPLPEDEMPSFENPSYAAIMDVALSPKHYAALQHEATLSGLDQSTIINEALVSFASLRKIARNPYKGLMLIDAQGEGIERLTL